MDDKRKQEVKSILRESHKRFLSGENKGVVLKDFMECQKKQRRSFKALEDILKYLKSYNIYFEMDQSEGTSRITMVFNHCDRCPGRIIEGCIWFYENSMEVRVYYSKFGAEICRRSKNLSELYRLMNYLNARLWIGVLDGMEGALYQSKCLICPRFYVTEDGIYDITATMLIPYTHFEMDILEIEDFITAALPSLLDSLSTPMFLLLEGRITIDEAIDRVSSEILGKEVGCEKY